MLTAVYTVLLVGFAWWATGPSKKPRVERRRPFHQLSEAEQWAERAERMFDRRAGK